MTDSITMTCIVVLAIVSAVEALAIAYLAHQVARLERRLRSIEVSPLHDARCRSRGLIR